MSPLRLRHAGDRPIGRWRVLANCRATEGFSLEVGDAGVKLGVLNAAEVGLDDR